MQNKLKRHWKVNNKELVLILCTFAITGIATAWISKEISGWLSLDKYGIGWWASKIIVIVFGLMMIRVTATISTAFTKNFMTI